MRIIRIIVFVLLLLSFSLFAYWNTSSISDMKFSRKVITNVSGYVKLMLDKDIYSATHPLLNDLRIVTESKIEVPYYLLTNKDISQKPSQEATILKKSSGAEGITINLSIYSLEKPVTNFNFSFKINEYYLKPEIQVSQDNKNWTDINVFNNLYSVPSSIGKGNDCILAEPISARFVNILLRPLKGNLSVDDIEKITYSSDDNMFKPSSKHDSKIISNFFEEKTNTLIIDNGFKNAPFDKIMFNFKNKGFVSEVSLFSSNDQQNWIPIGTPEEIYSLAIAKTYEEKTYINTSKINSRYIKSIIKTKDNAQLLIDSVDVLYVPEYIVFNAVPSESYTVNFGNSTIAKPNYDNEKLKSILDPLSLNSAIWANP